jgi:hypothetical protein
MTSSFEKIKITSDKEKMLQLDLEKVEITSIKLKEKYKDYQELVGFVDYIRASESIFLLSKAQNWNAEKLKEGLMKNELHIASMNAGVNEGVFTEIYNDFKTLSGNIGKIYDSAESLLKKYAKDEVCREFILYIRDISIVFVEVRNKEIDFDEAKDRLFNIKMKSLSIDGKHNLGMLEKIYDEFKKGLV